MRRLRKYVATAMQWLLEYAAVAMQLIVLLYTERSLFFIERFTDAIQISMRTKSPVDNSGSIAAGGSTANSGSIAAGGSTANSSLSADGGSAAKGGHSNMERKHAHVSWETTVTAVMVTVLLLSLATAKVTCNKKSTLRIYNSGDPAQIMVREYI